MHPPRNPFRLNVGFLVHADIGAAHEFPFDLELVEIGEDLELRNFHGTALLGRTPQGLLLTGAFGAESTLECVRCLKSFSAALAWNMTELYAFHEKSASESGLIVPEEARIDLQPLMREYALLEVPIKALCRPDCKGLCPVCGQDLNERDCGHRPAEGDSPFSVLGNLL